MPMTLTIGKSTATDEAHAAAEAVGSRLGSVKSPVLGLVFCTEQYDPGKLAASITSELGGIPWTGCSGAGVFSGTELLQHGVVAAILSSPGGEARVGMGMSGPVSGDAFEAGRKAALDAMGRLPELPPGYHRAAIVLCDGIEGNVAEALRGAAREAGTHVVWAGGGASDNLRFARSTEFFGGRAHGDQIIVILLDSPTPLAAGIRHGWRPLGPPVMVTRSRGLVASELEYEKAFDVYRDTAAEHGYSITRDGFLRFSMTHPLGIPQAGGEYVIRDPLAVGEDGSLRFVGEIPDGSLVRVMEGTHRAILDAGGQAARDARQAIPGPLAGAIIFDCVSRSLLLGPDVSSELRRFQTELGEQVPLIGCLTFGEVGSFNKGVPQFHNKTAVVLALAS